MIIEMKNKNEDRNKTDAKTFHEILIQSVWK